MKAKLTFGAKIVKMALKRTKTKIEKQVIKKLKKFPRVTLK